MGPSFYPNVDYWGFDSKPLNAAAAKRTIDDVAHSPQVALPNGFFQAVEVQTLRSIDNTVIQIVERFHSRFMQSLVQKHSDLNFRFCTTECYK